MPVMQMFASRRNPQGAAVNQVIEREVAVPTGDGGIVRTNDKVCYFSVEHKNAKYRLYIYPPERELYRTDAEFTAAMIVHNRLLEIAGESKALRNAGKAVPRPRWYLEASKGFLAGQPQRDFDTGEELIYLPRLRLSAVPGNKLTIKKGSFGTSVSGSPAEVISALVATGCTEEEARKQLADIGLEEEIEEPEMA